MKDNKIDKELREIGAPALAETREQIQEDVICFIESYGFLSHPEFLKENLCQIVVDNFKRLER
jgi:hypothetical protein